MDNFILFILFFAFFFLYGAPFLYFYVIWRKRQVESRLLADEALVAVWRPIFADCAVTNTFPERLPAITPGALPSFMSLWLYWISMTEGDARRHLLRAHAIELTPSGKGKLAEGFQEGVRCRRIARTGRAPFASGALAL